MVQLRKELSCNRANKAFNTRVSNALNDQYFAKTPVCVDV